LKSRSLVGRLNLVLLLQRRGSSLFLSTTGAEYSMSSAPSTTSAAPSAAACAAAPGNDGCSEKNTDLIISQEMMIDVSEATHYFRERRIHLHRKIEKLELKKRKVCGKLRQLPPINKKPIVLLDVVQAASSAAAN
jgi:hypothetical protein